jgi:flagellar motor switch protein FliN
MDAYENQDRLMAIPLVLRAMLPCRQLTIGDLLALEKGAVIETTRPAGDNVDVAISDRTVAQAELIVINSTLTIRLSEFTENS